MSEPKKQKPRGVFSEEQVGFLPWLFDQINTFITVEGDFALQFMADFIRGPEPAREEKHLERQMKIQASRGQHSSLRNVKNTVKSQGKPLSKAEQKNFVDLLKRKPSEKQVLYWKRKKALLNNPNKRELVMQHAAGLQLAAQEKAGTIDIDAGNFTIPQKQKRTAKQRRKR